MPITRFGKALEASKTSAKEAKTTNELLRELLEQQKQILKALNAPAGRT